MPSAVQIVIQQGSEIDSKKVEMKKLTYIFVVAGLASSVAFGHGHEVGHGRRLTPSALAEHDIGNGRLAEGSGSHGRRVIGNEGGHGRALNGLGG